MGHGHSKHSHATKATPHPCLRTPPWVRTAAAVCTLPSRPYTHGLMLHRLMPCPLKQLVQEAGQLFAALAPMQLLHGRSQLLCGRAAVLDQQLPPGPPLVHRVHQRHGKHVPVVLRLSWQAQDLAEGKAGRGRRHRRARAHRGAEVTQPPPAPHPLMKGKAERLRAGGLSAVCPHLRDGLMATATKTVAMRLPAPARSRPRTQRGRRTHRCFWVGAVQPP